MNLDDLYTLLDVARSGSVTRTAEALRLTQPTVSRRIQRLEASLGVTLLDRRARPVALTVAGRNLVMRLPKLFATLDELRDTGNPAGAGAPRFRLGLVTSLADRIAEDVVGRLRRVFPRLALGVVAAWTPELLGRFQRAELDAAVVYLSDEVVPPADADLRVLGRVPLVAVGPRGGRLAPASDDVATATWILNGSGCCFRDALTRAFRASGAPFHVGLEVDGIDRQLKLVAQGAGLGFVAAPLLRDSPVRSRLQPVPLPVPTLSIRVGMIARIPPPALHAVPDEIRRHLQRWLHGSHRARF